LDLLRRLHLAKDLQVSLEKDIATIIVADKSINFSRVRVFTLGITHPKLGGHY